MHHVIPTTRFIIPANLKIGDTAEFGTLQQYTCIDFIKTENGKTSIKWKGHCKACGVEFTCGSGFVTSGLNRNCDLHKRTIKYKVRDRKKELSISDKLAAISNPCRTENRADPAPPVARPVLDTWCSFTAKWCTSEEAKANAARGVVTYSTAASVIDENERKQRIEAWEKEKAQAKAQGKDLFDDILG